MEEDESSFGAFFEHLSAAGALNPFAVLGIAPVVGLTIEDICEAYDRAQRQVEKQGTSLPPTLQRSKIEF